MHTKRQISSTLSGQKMGCYSTMIDIHCLWSVSKSSLDAWDRYDELLCASFRPLWASSSYVPPRMALKLHKIPYVGYPLSTKMGCRSKRRVIHCFWSVSNPSWDAWDWWEELLIASVYQLLVPLSHFLPRLALKLHAKYHILDTLSVQKMGCWTARRDIHCLWSASNPFLDALSRWEELPCASVRHSCGPHRAMFHEGALSN